MREGIASRVMAADNPYGECYDFYSISPKYFGYTLVQHVIRRSHYARLLGIEYGVSTVNGKLVAVGEEAVMFDTVFTTFYVFKNASSGYVT
jgi:hypothetical protein